MALVAEGSSWRGGGAIAGDLIKPSAGATKRVPATSPQRCIREPPKVLEPVPSEDSVELGPKGPPTQVYRVSTQNPN